MRKKGNTIGLPVFSWTKLTRSFFQSMSVNFKLAMSHPLMPVYKANETIAFPLIVIILLESDKAFFITLISSSLR